MSAPPISATAEDLGSLLAESAVWYLDWKAQTELSGKLESLAGPQSGRSPQLRSLPILENIATKQATKSPGIGYL